MTVKLIMTWDISSDRNKIILNLSSASLSPLAAHGFELSDSWATVYGNSPQIMVSAVLPDAGEARQVMKSPEWRDLHGHLQDYVKNYTQKIVTARVGFQF